MARPCCGRHGFSRVPAAAHGLLERALAALDFASHAPRRALATAQTDREVGWVRGSDVSDELNASFPDRHATSDRRGALGAKSSAAGPRLGASARRSPKPRRRARGRDRGEPFAPGVPCRSRLVRRPDRIPCAAAGATCARAIQGRATTRPKVWRLARSSRAAGISANEITRLVVARYLPARTRAIRSSWAFCSISISAGP